LAFSKTFSGLSDLGWYFWGNFVYLEAQENALDRCILLNKLLDFFLSTSSFVDMAGRAALFVC